MGVIAKQSFHGTVANYIGTAIGFVTTFFVLTRFLSPEEIGLSNILVSVATLFMSFAQMGTMSSTVRFFPYFYDKEKNDYNGFFFLTLFLSLLGFVLVGIMYVLFHTTLSNWFGEKSALFVSYYYMVIPIAFCILYKNVFATNVLVFQKVVVSQFVNEVFIRLCLLAVYLLYAFRRIDLDGFVWGICASYGLAMLCNVVYFFHVSHISLKPNLSFFRSHIDLLKKYFSYTLYILFYTVIDCIAPYAATFFITAQLGLDYTGIYTIALNISFMVSMIVRAFLASSSTILAPLVKENDLKGIKRLISQYSNNSFLIGGLIFAVIWFNIDAFFVLLPNGATYAVAKNVIFVLCFLQLIATTFSIIPVLLNYSRFFVFSFVFSILQSVLAVVFNNYFIPIYGMMGSAISNLLFHSIWITCLLITIRITMHVSPFTMQLFKSLIFIILLFVCNFAFQQFLSPWLLPSLGIIGESALRSVILFPIALWVFYKTRLSEEVISNVLQFLTRKGIISKK